MRIDRRELLKLRGPGRSGPRLGTSGLLPGPGRRKEAGGLLLPPALGLALGVQRAPEPRGGPHAEGSGPGGERVEEPARLRGLHRRPHPHHRRRRAPPQADGASSRPSSPSSASRRPTSSPASTTPRSTRGRRTRSSSGRCTRASSTRACSFISLDNVSDPAGAVGDTQIDWLKSELGKLGQGRTHRHPRAPAAVRPLRRSGTGPPPTGRRCSRCSSPTGTSRCSTGTSTRRTTGRPGTSPTIRRSRSSSRCPRRGACPSEPPVPWDPRASGARPRLPRGGREGRRTGRSPSRSTT